MIEKILLFAGTTEGRTLAEALGRGGVRTHVCVATEYGKRLIDQFDTVTVSAERLDADEMLHLMREGRFDLIVDATHPYAVVVSRNIREACSGAGMKYLRLLRPEGRTQYGADIVSVPDVPSAVEYLKDTEGNVLVTTGSKELAHFTAIDGFRERVYARVLSMPSVAEACAAMGFEGKNLICMQGPFSEDLNYGMLKQIDAAYLVTKDSGQVGGFEEKIRAARRAGAKVVLIGRPPDDDGLSCAEVIEYLEAETGAKLKSSCDGPLPVRRKITLAGIGMGAGGTMTLDVAEACRTADLIIGARRVLASVDVSGKDTFVEYRAQEIMEHIQSHPEHSDVVVLFSGDVGFHSGALRMLQELDGSNLDVEVKCGIPSVAYFCSRLAIPWQDVFLMSAHGRDANFPGEVRRHAKIFTLLDGGHGVRELCSQLESCGLGGVRVTIGQNLSYDDEVIVAGHPQELLDREFDGLCVALIENDRYDTVRPAGMDDNEFIRGDAPMTKSEVRALILSKLRLGDNSLIYDIGAGTGSVSVEMAMSAVNGTVYAIEKDAHAVGIIGSNVKRFGVPNVRIVEGAAPEAFEGLPMPTHAFIGGSSGNMREIIERLLELNPEVRLVISAIALETVGEVVRCVEELGLDEEETVNISISRSRRVGGYHLMMAQNPVYLTVCSGRRT